jgi:NADH-quinone oxidoreductase subunit C
VTSNRSDLLEALGTEFAAAVGAASFGVEHDTLKVRVSNDQWVAAATAARDDFGLNYFCYLSAIDWANDVAVGDAPLEPVEERFELLAAIGDVTEGRLVHLSTDLPKEGASIGTLSSVFPGANWHEREASEMFNIDFDGHPNLIKIYLPDGFEGHPLQKSFGLLAREVKPWPGDVDVEGLPGDDE